MTQATLHQVYWSRYKSAMLLLATATSAAVCALPTKAQKAVGQSIISSQHEKLVTEQLAADLKTLSQRLKVSFVIEGQPIACRPAALPGSPQATSSQQTSVKDEAVLEVAKRYDYSAVRRGNIFILNKLYTDPGDIPDVSPEECLLALRDATHILDPFNPRIPPEDRLGSPQANIARMLTPQQLNDLSHGGLNVMSLAAPQREEAWRLALYYYVQAQAQAADHIVNFLESLARQDPLFHSHQVSDVVAFGYDFRSTTSPEPVFIPISHANRVAVTPDGATIVMSHHHENNGVLIEDTDPTNPTAKDLLQVLPADPSPAITLAQATAELNKRDKAEARYQVDKAFVTKRVLIIGKEEASSAKIMDALATVYGLRVIHKAEGVLILSQMRNLPPADVTGLAKSMRNVIPIPLLHALQARMKAQQYSPGNAMRVPVFRSGDYQSGAQLLHLTAIRQLRALAEPKVRAAKDTELTLSNLGEQAQRLFAISTVVDTLAQICWLVERPTPPYVADFDHVVLTGGAYQNMDGEARFSLFLSYPNPLTGELSRGVGFMNARLSK